MRRFLVVAMLLWVATLGGGGWAGPVEAAAPPPPLDACLQAGSFNLADGVCRLYAPQRGAQYGPISGIGVVTAPRGVPIALAIPGGTDVGFGSQPGELCGELGCIRNGTSWRIGGSFAEGLAFRDGCGAEDVTCTVVSNPPLVGDRGEVYQVVYGQVNHGINPTAVSMMWAFYTPPTIYPVELTPVDSSGARLALDHTVLAYAVHEGADPVAGACVEPFWYEAVLSQPVPPVPDCVTFRRGGDIYSLEGSFEGWLPVDSGSWTIVAQPAGNPSASLLSRPSGYQHIVVRPVGDDISTSILAQRRPSLSLRVVPATAEMALGSSQTVEVTVTADGGEAGGLDGLQFADEAVLTVSPIGDGQAAEGPVLTAAAPDAAPPAGGFRLSPGEERRFRVELAATALGAADVRVSIAGHDDLGTPLAVDQGEQIVVTQDGPAASASAPRPPVVTIAADLGPGTADTIAGTVDGTPGTTVVVDLAAGTRGTPDECLQQMIGEGVTLLGSLEVTIGDNGTGSFSLTGPLDPGQDVYGRTTSGAVVSAVGPCLPVEAADTDAPTLDLRGEWRVTDRRNGLTGTMTITRQDRETGKVVGIVDSADGRMRVTGTLKGTRLTLTFTASDGSAVGATGRVTRNGGRTEILLRSRDGKALASLTLVAPAGG